jgi:nicotinamidase-related amidase
MNTVVNLHNFRQRGRELPTLVLIDLHHDVLIGETEPAPLCSEAISNCRAALRHARACGIPVAFTRQVVPPVTMVTSPAYPKWIEGFEPNRWDMIFDRQRPSCYTSAEFSEVAEELGGNYVMAGRFGELSCLSTAVEALHRDHHPAVLTDALMCLPEGKLSAGVMQQAAASILSHYVGTTTTQAWIRATSRKVGAIK